jgi:hypothetical protein
MRIVENDGDGDCLPRAIATALKAEGQEEITPGEVRYRIVRRMRRGYNWYSKRWDGCQPAEGNRALEGSFADYLALLKYRKAWMGDLELHAAAAEWERPLVLFRPALNPRLYGPPNGQSTLKVWFEQQHFQMLLGMPTDEEIVGAEVAEEVRDQQGIRGGVPAWRRRQQRNARPRSGQGSGARVSAQLQMMAEMMQQMQKKSTLL